MAFQSFDIFGAEISLKNQDGRSTSRSIIGSIYSLILFIVIILYLIAYFNWLGLEEFDSILKITKVRQDSSNANVKISVIGNWFEMFTKNNNYNQIKNKFFSDRKDIFNGNIAFALMNITTKSLYEIDITKLNFEVYNEVNGIKYPLFYDICTNFKGVNADDFESFFSLNKAYCIKSNFILSPHDNLRIKVNKCKRDTKFLISNEAHIDYYDKYVNLPYKYFNDEFNSKCDLYNSHPENRNVECPLQIYKNNYNYYLTNVTSLLKMNLNQVIDSLNTTLYNDKNHTKIPQEVDELLKLTKIQYLNNNLQRVYETINTTSGKQSHIAFNKEDARKFTILNFLIERINFTISTKDENINDNRTDYAFNPLIEEKYDINDIYHPSYILVHNDQQQEIEVICDTESNIDNYLNDIQVIYISSFDRLNKITLEDDLIVNYFSLASGFYQYQRSSLKLNEIEKYNYVLPTSLSSSSFSYYVSHDKFDSFTNNIGEDYTILELKIGLSPDYYAFILIKSNIFFLFYTIGGIAIILYFLFKTITEKYLGFYEVLDNINTNYKVLFNDDSFESYIKYRYYFCVNEEKSEKQGKLSKLRSSSRLLLNNKNIKEFIYSESFLDKYFDEIEVNFCSKYISLNETYLKEKELIERIEFQRLKGFSEVNAKEEIIQENKIKIQTDSNRNTNENKNQNENEKVNDPCSKRSSMEDNENTENIVKKDSYVQLKTEEKKKIEEELELQKQYKINIKGKGYKTLIALFRAYFTNKNIKKSKFNLRSFYLKKKAEINYIRYNKNKTKYYALKKIFHKEIKFSTWEYVKITYLCCIKDNALYKKYELYNIAKEMFLETTDFSKMIKNFNSLDNLFDSKFSDYSQSILNNLPREMISYDSIISKNKIKTFEQQEINDHIEKDLKDEIIKEVYHSLLKENSINKHGSINSDDSFEEIKDPTKYLTNSNFNTIKLDIEIELKKILNKDEEFNSGTTLKHNIISLLNKKFSESNEFQNILSNDWIFNIHKHDKQTDIANKYKVIWIIKALNQSEVADRYDLFDLFLLDSLGLGKVYLDKLLNNKKKTHMMNILTHNIKKKKKDSDEDEINNESIYDKIANKFI